MDGILAIVAWGIVLLIPVAGLFMASKGAKDHNATTTHRR